MFKNLGVKLSHFNNLGTRECHHQFDQLIVSDYNTYPLTPYQTLISSRYNVFIIRI